MGLLDKILGKKGETKRAVVIGMDGVPFPLLQKLCGDGTMPNLATLLEEGAFSPMDAPIPEISSVSWTTFFTGKNPGRHGLYGFVDLRPSSYKMYFPNLTDVRGAAIWDVLGRASKRSVVLNMPSTYPARPLAGVLCSGFVALDLRKATYPDEAHEYLQGIGYRIDADTRLVRESRARFLQDIRETLDLRRKALLHFFDEGKWDLFMGVITATDRLQHFFYEDILEEGAEFHDGAMEIYRESDRIIGEIAGRVREREDTALILMSDHGFGLLDQQVYVNHWLQQEGYLSFQTESPKSVADISGEARAFALDPSRIYIHLKGRYPRGCVEPGEQARQVREEIAERIQSLEVRGKPVVRRVCRREEIYSGPLEGSGPDLVLLSHKGFDLKGALGKGVLHNREIFTGMHTQDDAFLYVRGAQLTGEKPHIMDLAPTILALMGMEIPEDMDGRVLVEEPALG